MSTAEGVQAQITAVDAIGSAVQSFAQRAKASSLQARSLARDFETKLGDEHERRCEMLRGARELRDAASRALQACKEDCGGLERALADAERKVQEATRRADVSAKALADVGEAIQRFGQAERTFETALDNHASRASAGTQQLSGQLHQYLGSHGENDRTSASSQRPSGSVSSPSISGVGAEKVSLSQIDDDRKGRPLSFEKVSRDKVSAGLDRLKSVVEPAVTIGKGADYFKARDAAEGLSGEQSYSGIHNWFYNSDHAIKLTRTGSGRFEVTNGYHRLAVAREMGIESLPVIVR